MHGTFNKTSVILVYVLNRTIVASDYIALKSLFSQRVRKRGQIR